MVALTSYDVCLTVALASNLDIFWPAGTGCVAPVSNKNRSIKVAVAGKACVRMIELLFRVFVEAFQTKLLASVRILSGKLPVTWADNL